MKKGIITVCLAVSVALLLGGCFGYVPSAQGTPLPSGATPAPTPTVGPQVDPQKLISRAEAEQLVGNALKDPDKDKINGIPSEGMTFCLYDTEATNGRFLQVSVFQRTETYNGDPRAVFDALKTPAANSTAQPAIAAVSGVGDEAFIADPGLHMMYKGYYILIAVGDPRDPANQEILKAAGKKAAENLDKLLG